MKTSTSCFKWLCMLFLIAFGALQAKAEEVTETFDEIGGTDGLQVTSLPDGWGYIGSLTSFVKDDTRRVGKSGYGISYNSTAKNYLVTPVLSGSVSFQLRCFGSSYTGYCELYYCTENEDGTFTRGAQIGSYVSANRSSYTTWYTHTFNNINESRVAILLERAAIDNFTYTPVSDEPIDETKALTITAFERTSDAEVDVDANNKFSASFNVTVKNSGEEALTADEVSVTVSSGSYAATATATADLAVGGSVTIPVTVSNVDAGTSGGNFTFSAKENVSKSTFETTQTVFAKVKHLQITSFSRTGDLSVYVDENGLFSAAFSITVKNAGSVELSAEEVSVSLTSSNTSSHTVYATATASAPLAVGASVKIPIEATNVPGEPGYKYFYAKENLEGKIFTESAYVRVYPYESKFTIYAEGAYSQLPSSTTVDFGSKVTTTVSKNYEIRNAGPKPLNVSSITVPEGFTVDPSSFTVAGNGSQVFTVSLVPQEGVYGTFQGKVVITHDLGEFSFPVKGTTVDPDNIVIDFAGGVFPSEWTKIGDFTTGTWNGGTGHIKTTTPGGMQSPRIVIKEGNKLSFKAEKYGSYYASTLTISYSYNGVDWTVAHEFGSEFTTSYQTFEVDEIPAGKWFVKIEGTYLDIDDITGFGYAKEQLENLTISSVGYATFAPKQNVTIPDGAEVFIVTAMPENNSVKLAAVSGSLAAGEGVIVKGEPSTIVSFETTASASEIGENLLIGTTAATDLAEGEAYILAAEDGKAVFSLCSAGTIAAGKSYLPASVSSAPTLWLEFEDATAIEKAELPQTEALYNLAGQKVGADYKGIVIKNGVKMLKK